jgi:hypothetical protein
LENRTATVFRIANEILRRFEKGGFAPILAHLGLTVPKNPKRH